MKLQEQNTPGETPQPIYAVTHSIYVGNDGLEQALWLPLSPTHSSDVPGWASPAVRKASRSHIGTLHLNSSDLWNKLVSVSSMFNQTGRLLSFSFTQENKYNNLDSYRSCFFLHFQCNYIFYATTDICNPNIRKKKSHLSQDHCHVSMASEEQPYVCRVCQYCQASMTEHVRWLLVSASLFNNKQTGFPGVYARVSACLHILEHLHRNTWQ